MHHVGFIINVHICLCRSLLLTPYVSSAWGPVWFKLTSVKLAWSCSCQSWSWFCNFRSRKNSYAVFCPKVSLVPYESKFVWSTLQPFVIVYSSLSNNCKPLNFNASFYFTFFDLFGTFNFVAWMKPSEYTILLLDLYTFSLYLCRFFSCSYLSAKFSQV